MKKLHTQWFEPKVDGRTQAELNWNQNKHLSGTSYLDNPQAEHAVISQKSRSEQHDRAFLLVCLLYKFNGLHFQDSTAKRQVSSVHKIRCTGLGCILYRITPPGEGMII